MPFVRDPETGETRWVNDAEYYNDAPAAAAPAVASPSGSSSGGPSPSATTGSSPYDPNDPYDPRNANNNRAGQAGVDYGIGAAGGDYGIDPSYLAPWQGTFTPKDAPAPFDYQMFAPPAPFKMPTAADVYADPSYQFRLDEGRDALEASASARGVLNSGGTLGDVLKYGQNFASQEYGNIADRNFSIWNNDWTHALDTYGTNRSNAADIYTKNYNAYDDQEAQAWQQYQDQKSTFYTNQNNAYQKILGLAALGSAAA